MSKRNPNGTRSGLILGVLVSALIFSVAEAEEIHYDKGNQRDPFQPLIGPNAFRGVGSLGKETFPVEGIIFDSKEGSYAILGGEIYREGETVNGVQLVKILPDRILLHRQSEELVIWLHEEILEADQKRENRNEKT